MATEVKRMRFFDGLFLKEEEFRLDQNYNIRMRRLHNRYLHGYGIVWGLDVEVGANDTEFVIKEGMAIDLFVDPTTAEETGREILVPVDATISISSIPGAAGNSVYIYVYYEESQADVVAELGGPEPIHWVENAAFAFSVTDRLADEKENLLLARIDVAGDGTIDASSIVTVEGTEELRTYIQQEVEGGTTIIQQGGTGKNYVVNTGADADTANWSDAASGNFTVGSTTVAGQVLAGTASFALSATASVAADTDYVTVALNDIDEEDKNQLMSVEFSYKNIAGLGQDSLKVVVRDTTNNVDIVPTPARVPTGQGRYRAYFNTSNSLTYELRLVAGESNAAFSLAVDSVIVGPDRTTVGPAIGGWQPYDLEITSTGSPDPVKATNPDRDQAFWRRVGDSMEIHYVYYHTNNAGASNGVGAYLFSIPEGYTIDAAKIDVPGFVSATRGICGSCAFDNGSNDADALSGTVNVYDTTHLLLQGAHESDMGIPNNSFTGFIGLATSVCAFGFRATVPIAEWQSDVILAESRTEYVYNSDTSASDNTSSFAVGEIGGIVPSIPGGPGGYEFTSAVRKRIRLSRSYKHVSLEFDVGARGTWSSSSKYNRMVVFNSTSGSLQPYGAILEPVGGSINEWDVTFYGNATLDEAQANVGWDTVATNEGTRWRVVASDNPFFLEAPPNVDPGDVGPWTDAGPMTIIGTQGNPTFGNVITNKISWRRVGDTMEFAGQFHQTSAGTNGTGEWHIELPAGLNAARVAYESNGPLTGNGEINDLFSGSNTWGSFTAHQVSTKGANGSIQFVNSRRFTFLAIESGGNWVPFVDTNFSFANPDFMFSFKGSVPIDEWTNTDLVLRESLTEYVYNSDSSNADDTTSFATGADGGLAPTSSGSAIVKYVRFSRPYRHYKLEFQEDGIGPWLPAGSSRYAPMTSFGGASVVDKGAFLVPVNETELYVRFLAAGTLEGTSAVRSWDTENSNGTRWRVVGSDNPLFVESPEATQGNVVGPWTDVGPMVIKSYDGTDPTPSPSVAFNKMQYRRVGESMEIIGSYHHTAAGGAGTGAIYSIEIPEGLRASADILTDGITNRGAANSLGSAQVHRPGTAGHTGVVQLLDDRNFTFYLIGGNYLAFGASWTPLSDAEIAFSFRAMIPIDEWSGEQVVLAENSVEYVYNTDTANGTDTSSFATGENGGRVPQVASTIKLKRVQFSRPFRHYQLEFQDSGVGPWLPVGGSRFQAFKGGGTASTVDNGSLLIPVSQTEFDVQFNVLAALIGSSALSTWADEYTNGTRWRVVGCDNPLLVESPDPIQGNVIGPWTDVGPIVVKGTTSDPVFSTTDHNFMKYRRVGESMEIEGAYHHTGTGTAGSGRYFIEIPEGLHAVDNGTFSLSIGDNVYGNCLGVWPSNGTSMTGNVQLIDNRGFTFFFDPEGAVRGFDAGAMDIVQPGFKVSFQASIPISEWSGGDVVLSESRVEYVSNSDASDADDTTSFSTGENGEVVPVVSTADKKKRVRLSRVFKHVRVEVQPSGAGTWMSVGDSLYNYQVRNPGGTDEYYGIQAERVSNTEWDIHFGHDGHGYGNAITTNSWGTENSNGTRWRVVGSDNPALVQAPQAQFLAATSDPHTPSGSAVAHQMTGNSVTLQPGSWRVSGEIIFGSPVSPSGYTHFSYFWATANGDNTPAAPTQITAQAGRTFNSTEAPVSNGYYMVAGAIRVNVTVATTLYLVPGATMGTPSNSEIIAYIYAERLD